MPFYRESRTHKKTWGLCLQNYCIGGTGEMSEGLPVYLDQMNFEDTVRDYEYTRKAEHEILRVVDSGDFEEMDSEAIFRYLYKEMQLVSFKDYLKRYIYERAGLTEPYLTVPDTVFMQIITESFAETSTPHSFEPTTTKWTATVKGWLTHDSVRRTSVFLLGFGLRMSVRDVSAFLTKVLKESDFDFSSPEETAYWYCYKNQLRYADCCTLLKDRSGPSGNEHIVVNNEEEALREGLDQKDKLLAYVRWLSRSGGSDRQKAAACQHFDLFMSRTRAIIAGFFQKDEDEMKSGKVWKAADVTAADIEKVVCCGIPFTGNGNLQKASASLLGKHFHNYRLSRQRIEALKNRKYAVDRYDLLTLLFFIYSQKTDLMYDDRCRAFLDEANSVLQDCGMMKVHPVNPYESFILMCLLSEEPLASYADVLEMSYEER